MRRQMVDRAPCDLSGGALKTSRSFLTRLSLFTSAVLTGLLLADATLATPPEGVGGSNYGWYAMDGCARENFSIVSDYPRNKAVIDDELGKMFRGGQRRLRLPIFYARGIINPTILNVETGGLDPRDRDNIAALIAAIAHAGFEEVIVGSFPLGANDPVVWPEWREDRYRENWSVITTLRGIMDASGLPYKLDLQNEGTPFPFQLMLKAYVHRVWQDYVHAYGPTKTIGVSAIPKEGRILEIPKIYDGILPEALDFHIGEDAYNKFLEVDRLLTSLGIDRAPIIIGEALYNDATEASELARAAKAIPRRILFLTQWPLTRDAPCKDVSVLPFDFDAYRKQGF